MDTGDARQIPSQLDAEEYRALTSVLTAFTEYGVWARKELIEPRQARFDSLPSSQQQLLSWFPQHLRVMSRCIDSNARFLQTLALAVAADWGVPADPSYWSPCKYLDLDKVRAVLVQASREWSLDGATERSASFGPLVDALDTVLFPHLSPLERAQVEVLVPGAGLGRLVLEVVLRGYRCQGNEFSFHMLLASNFFLNKMTPDETSEIFPYIHRASHKRSRELQTRAVAVPDVSPVARLLDWKQRVPECDVQELMSIATGSFVDLYGPNDVSLMTESDFYTTNPASLAIREANRGSYDVVATCFFLDTASNIVEYLLTIHHTLKPGGHWLNFGPLLWHFEDDDNETETKVTGQESRRVPLKGLEMARDDLIALCERIGFEFVKITPGIKTTYGGDKESLGGWLYECDFWIAKKIEK